MLSKLNLFILRYNLMKYHRHLICAVYSVIGFFFAPSSAYAADNPFSSVGNVIKKASTDLVSEVGYPGMGLALTVIVIIAACSGKVLKGIAITILFAGIFMTCISAFVEYATDGKVKAS